MNHVTSKRESQDHNKNPEDSWQSSSSWPVHQAMDAGGFKKNFQILNYGHYQYDVNSDTLCYLFTCLILK